MRRSIAVFTLVLAACNSHQSTLAPFGAEARSTMGISLVLAIGAGIIALGTAIVMLIAVRAPEGRLNHAGGMRLVLWLGAIVPTMVLAALLVWTLPAMRPLPAGEADLRVQVEGEQFWWRVRYLPGGRGAVRDANEVRIPVGRAVTFELTAADVVHSFWIPGLAGKMDMIPGRTNRLVVKADKAGRYRGVCAEFCGLSHALMAFDVIAMEPAAFDAWLAAARQPRPRSAGRGAEVFARNGCGACHAVAGTTHAGQIGPDLSRMDRRLTLGAGILPADLDHISAFIRDPHRFKPGARMPAYADLSEADARAVAVWLKETR